MNNAAVAAIHFALETDEGLAYLRCWNEGDFQACRKEWPEAPEACYIGADLTHPETAKDIVSWEFQSAMKDVAQERRRQIFDKGFDAENDNKYLHGELAAGAGTYALWAAQQIENWSQPRAIFTPPECWPFSKDWWRPGDVQRTMVKALAMGFAQLEHLKRIRNAHALLGRTAASEGGSLPLPSDS